MVYQAPSTLAVGLCTAAWVLFAALSHGAVEKLVDTTLFESNDVTYRWSEGSTINLDDKDHLLMAVTVFGAGGHDNTQAEILGLHSHDGGITWTSLEQAQVLQANVGEENTMSPALVKLANGDILMFVNVKNSIRDCGPWVKRSADGGKTWGELSRLPYEGYGGVGSDRAVQTTTGRVILPCWVSTDALASTRVCCFYSDDMGRTWARTEYLSTPKGSTGRKTDPAAEEPMVIELKDGRLMMIMRTYLKSIYRCFSDDGGASWSRPESSGIPSPGSMATIKRLPNGDILLVYNWARLSDINGPWPRNFITTAISQDEGRNFTCLRHLDGAEEFQGKITMANVAFAAGEKVVITYSKSMTKKNAYNWRLQVLPLQWLYEGDNSQTYGEDYLPALGAALRPDEPRAPAIPRPTPQQHDEALKRMPSLTEEDEALVAAYEFEEAQGDFVYDLSGRGNDLAVQRVGEFPKSVEGHSGKCMDFGGRGFLMAPDAEALAFAEGRFTFEAWVYPTAHKEHSIIATKEHTWEVGLLDGRLKAAVRSGGSWGGIGWLGDAQIPLHRWTHIAVAFNGRRLSFHVNGACVKVASRIAKMDRTGEPLVIGGCTNIDDSAFAGRLDSIRIWTVDKYAAPEGAAMGNDNGEPRTVDATHQLFIDDALIASLDGPERVVNRPVRYHENPVLTYEKPWEGNCVIAWGSVLYDEEGKLFRAWYEAYRKYAAPGEQTLVCYAESPDGIHWTKPDLGLHEFHGSKANNIVLMDRESSIDAPTVLVDPKAPAERRYRLYWYSGEQHGVRGATSADGLRWDVLPGVLVKAGDRNTVMYDPESSTFNLITRIPDRGLRTCGLWQSPDGQAFTYIGEIAAPDEQDPKKAEFYGMIRFPYAGMQLGFLEMFFVPLRKLNTQLMYSPGGDQWHRAGARQTFLDWGPPGAWDQAWVTPSHNAPIRVGDKLFVFYQGRQTLHWAEAPFGHIGGIGLAFLRPDGFVSLDAQNAEGSVTTTPLLLEGDVLHINATARPGLVCAEVLDAQGAPLEGFARADCIPLSMTDALDHPLHWAGGRSLAELAGKPVRLRLYLQGAKLFSFWMT